jgi:hypothetical protein
MSAKHKPLSEKQFSNLYSLENWTLAEVPKQDWASIPGLQRQEELIGVMISGSFSDPRTLNGIHSIAGIDALVHETNPMDGEPPGNAYHYVIQKTNHHTCPYLIHGPFRRETIVDHWFTSDQLDRYFVCGMSQTFPTPIEIQPQQYG